MLLTGSSSTMAVGPIKWATSFLDVSETTKGLTRPRNGQHRSSGFQGTASRLSSKTAPTVGMRKTKGETIDPTLRSRTRSERKLPCYANVRIHFAWVGLGKNRSMERRSPTNSRNLIAFFRILHAKQSRWVDSDKYPQPVINFEDSRDWPEPGSPARKTLQRCRSKGYDKVRIDRFDFVKQPVPAYRYLAGVGPLMQPPLAARLKLEVFNCIRHINACAVHTRVRHRFVQQASGRPDERASVAIFRISGCSPTNMISAFAGPSPNTVCDAPIHSGQA